MQTLKHLYKASWQKLVGRCLMMPSDFMSTLRKTWCAPWPHMSSLRCVPGASPTVAISGFILIAPPHLMQGQLNLAPAYVHCWRFWPDIYTPSKTPWLHDSSCSYGILWHKTWIRYSNTYSTYSFLLCIE